MIASCNDPGMPDVSIKMNFPPRRYLDMCKYLTVLVTRAYRCQELTSLKLFKSKVYNQSELEPKELQLLSK